MPPPKMISIAAPDVAYPGPSDTNASLMRVAAEHIDGGYPIGGSNLSAAVAGVLRNVATALDEGDEPEATHDLVISYGDEILSGHCSCGHSLGQIRPDQSLNVFGSPWERHAMGAHA